MAIAIQKPFPKVDLTMLCNRNTTDNFNPALLSTIIEPCIIRSDLSLRTQDELHNRATPTLGILTRNGGDNGLLAAKATIVCNLILCEGLGGFMKQDSNVLGEIAKCIIEEHDKMCLHHVIEALRFGARGKYSEGKVYSLNYPLINRWLCQYTDDYIEAINKLNY